MCLDIVAEVEALDFTGLKDLTDGWPASESHFTAQGKGLLGRHPPRLWLHGCGLLSDDADWNAPTWAMTRAGTAALIDACQLLFDRVTGDIHVQATWGGERPAVEVDVSRPAFLNLVRHGALRTKTGYRVRT